MASRVLFVCALVTLVLQVHAIEKDPGAWLARELGLDSTAKQREALNELQKTAPPSSNQQAEPLDAKLIQRQRDIRARIAQDPEALKDAEQLADELNKLANQDTANSFDRKQVLALLVRVHRDLAQGLMQRDQIVESLLEVHAIKSICSQNAGLDCPPLLADQIQQTIEAVISRRGPYGLLGLQPMAEPRQVKLAHRKLMLLLHPDKNHQLDEQARRARQELFVRVKQAYEQITTSRANN